jgi:solute carrier family 25 (mitochondrial carnitine/acylcarnitine transporter), member 20/29
MAGWIGGIGKVLSGQPFDLLKVKLQIQDPANPTYSGLGDCFRKTFKREGVGAFYKGTLVPLFGVGLVSAIQFMVYEETRKYLKVTYPLSLPHN